PEINIHMKQFNKDTEISSRVYSQLIDCCHDIISVEQRGIIKKNSETTHELKLIVSYNDRDYMKEIEMEYSTSSGRIITIPRHYKIIELKSFDSIFSTKSLESTKNVLKTNTDYNDEFIDSIDNLLMAGFDNDMFRIAYQNNRVSKVRKVIIENESDINRTRELIHQNVEKYLKNNDDIYTVIVDSNTKLEVLTQLRDKGCVLYDEHPGF
ncbi:MAG: hypothetical protein KKF89_03775, partial [Nanoarchaeota archaeon]|nr:hypothetical protein [Nanoarchaeota archaeon]